MRLSGYLLLAVACLASVHAMPTELTPPVVSAPSTQEGVLPSSGWGLASLDALAQRINDWVAPVVRVIEAAVKNKTVTEVVVDARNATVQLAERVSESEAVQGAKDVFAPLSRFFDQIHGSVKDKTLSELAGDIQREVQQLDQSVAKFIRGLGGDREDQEIVDQLLPAAPGAPEDPVADLEQQVIQAATELNLAENEVEP